MVDRGARFQQFALSFGDMKGAYVLLPGPSGGRLSARLKVWELHRRDRAGQGSLCCPVVLVTVRFAPLSVLRRKSL